MVEVNKITKYNLFTDGGCEKNPSNGAWAFILKTTEGELVARKCGYEVATTNNRVELLAAINGIKETAAGTIIHLISDSTYLVKGLTLWRFNWRKKDWKGVLNTDLWKELSNLADKRIVTAGWVKGHDKNIENNEADDMCTVCMELNK